MKVRFHPQRSVLTLNNISWRMKGGESSNRRALPYGRASARRVLFISRAARLVSICRRNMPGLIIHPRIRWSILLVIAVLPEPAPASTGQGR